MAKGLSASESHSNELNQVAAMGQSVLFLSIAATLTIVVILIAVGRTSTDTGLELDQYHYDVLAREAAASGLNLTRRRLMADTAWTVNPMKYAYSDTPFRSGTFSTRVVPVAADTVDVVSTGVVRVATHVIEARYAKRYVTVSIPRAMRYSAYSDANLSLNGQARISSVRSGTNASVHSNGSLSSTGFDVYVEGFGTYGSSGSGPADDAAFVPNVDSNGADPNVFQDQDVDTPLLAASDYLDDATYATAGDTTLAHDMDFTDWNGITGFGSRDHPFLLYVDGNLTITGDPTFSGYVQIVTSGAISIQSDVKATVVPPPVQPASDEQWQTWAELNLDTAGDNQIGWYSEGTITVGGSLTVVGHLYSKVGLVMNGGGGTSTNIVGGVTSPANLNLSVAGGVNIWYATISEAAVLPGWSYRVPEGVRLIAYAEW